MNQYVILGGIIVYFGILFLISKLTSRGANNESFFIGNHKSPWYLVAFGMIGTSISGVTFVSVPGYVLYNSFGYLQMVMGFLVGYIIIATVLLPMYYKLKVTSIYTYLQSRFGEKTYKTGASFFLLSRTIGSAARLFLAASVLQVSVFNAWNVPFIITIFITIASIWLYTYKGGIKTIIWTDSVQTLFFLASVAITVIIITKELGLSFSEMVDTVKSSKYSQIFFFENFKGEKNHFIKQFLYGILICVSMTGLDQDLMQKNLSCKNIREAQKNMFSFSFIMFIVNLLFLSLGVMLYLYAQSKSIQLPVNAHNLVETDKVYPLIATGGFLPTIVSLIFLLGLIASTCASSDSALTALTTSFVVDILGKEKENEEKLSRIRKRTHLGFSVILLIVVMIIQAINDQSIIDAIYIIAAYTYGPLLGMFAFGFISKRKVKDNAIPYIAIISPILSYIISLVSVQLWNYKFGNEILLINAFITIIGMRLFIIKKSYINI